jgi:hypothetical protein
MKRLVVYEGGNFVVIAEEGFEHKTLGETHIFARMNRGIGGIHGSGPSHRTALSRARELVRRWNLVEDGKSSK